MLKRCLLNRWTLILLAGLVSAALYYVGYEQSAQILMLVVLSFVVIKTAYKNEQAIGTAYCSGILTGIAGLSWLYSLAATPLLIAYMSGPVQARSWRMAFALLIGVATPFWIYLPFFLYSRLQAALL